MTAGFFGDIDLQEQSLVVFVVDLADGVHYQAVDPNASAGCLGTRALV